MYDWLSEALDDSGTVSTANRRLTRLLRSEFAAQQQAAGKLAWRSPRISAWNDWLLDCSYSALYQETLPTRINAHQSQWLWEQCWRQEIGERDVAMAQLVRQSRDTWQRLSDWQIEIPDIVRAAQNEDQRTFAAVASRYSSALKRKDWLDDAGMASLVLDLIQTRRSNLTGIHTFVGFDRQRPIAAALQNAMQEIGAETQLAPVTAANASVGMKFAENDTAELRAAGRWAREYLVANDDAKVAIVADGLDSDADRIARMVREGFTPGWQHGHGALFDALNVSYGRSLVDFPAVVIAQLILRWLYTDIASTDVRLLLRTPIVGKAGVSGRSRLDLLLGDLPDRDWSPSMVTAELRGRDECPGVSEWLEHIANLSKRRREAPSSASPSEWAVFFDDTLKLLGWPGAGSLNSGEFQLINRWRELLNEFARLALVSPRMTMAAAIARLDLMAAETIFQPESTRAVLQLLGPLEAAGAEFDAIWITGVSSANWPPAGTPSALVSKRLQEAHGMPDCTPDDTLQYAENVLQRLIGSASTVVCSFAQNVDDTEQSSSDLLNRFSLHDESATADPGWYASRLLQSQEIKALGDSVPAIAAGEKLKGGASVIQRQMDEPLSAFVFNRLNARTIGPQAYGIPAPMRGNLLHDAFRHLYQELPTSQAVQGWRGSDLDKRIAGALNSAFFKYEKNADVVLRQLLLLERSRLAVLLREFVAVDAARADFNVASVEGEFEFVSGNIRLKLRFDRLDQFDDGSYAILDYKSGTKKLLLNKSGDVLEIQLFVYAAAIDATVSALALVNIDSREISFAGAGRGYTDESDWPELLQQVNSLIATACSNLVAGDVRIVSYRDVQDARRLNPLSRYTELHRDIG